MKTGEQGTFNKVFQSGFQPLSYFKHNKVASTPELTAQKQIQH